MAFTVQNIANAKSQKILLKKKSVVPWCNENKTNAYISLDLFRKKFW